MSPAMPGVEHREEGGEPFECRTVADRGGQGDDRRAGQPGDDAGQGAVHPGRDDDDLGTAQEGDLVQNAVQAGNADVDQCLGCPTEVAGGELRLASNRDVGGSGRDNEHEPTGRRGRFGWPGKQFRCRVMAGIGKYRPNGCDMVRVCSGEEGDRGLLTDGGGDGGDLFGCLAGAVDRFGVPAAGCAAEVQGGNPWQRPRCRVMDVNHGEPERAGG
jgi:hypothetical protein